MVAATTEPTPSDDVGSSGAPASASDSVPVDTTPIDTEASAPSTTPSSAADTADTPASLPEAAVPGSVPNVDDERQDSVSPWWWVLGGLAAFAAFGGIMFSLRRRTDDEAWARRASTMCDTGRALAATISGHLDEATTWDPPERVAHQRERFTSYLHDATDVAPSAELAELAAAVSIQNDELGRLLDTLSIGTPIDDARPALGPTLNQLAEVLTTLEHEASTVVYGAALPSTRTTG